MAFETGARDVLSRFEFTFDDVLMIHMDRFLGQIVCRVAGWLIRAWEEVRDRNENHNDDAKQSHGPERETAY
jgi:hypothetical protein